MFTQSAICGRWWFALSLRKKRSVIVDESMEEVIRGLQSLVRLVLICDRTLFVVASPVRGCTLFMVVGALSLHFVHGRSLLFDWCSFVVALCFVNVHHCACSSAWKEATQCLG